MKNSINDKAALEIQKCFEEAAKYSVIPSFESYKLKKLEIIKEYDICNNCLYIKAKSVCQRCPKNIKTKTNNFLIFNAEAQLRQIITRNFSNIKNNKCDIKSLGYGEKSKLFKFHSNPKNKTYLTFTLNTDGVSIFRNNSNDTWPIFLVINELKVKQKFAIQNIILLGLWSGKTKINNRVIMNEIMQYLSKIEKTGVIVNDENFKFATIYGSFDKPAGSLILNTCYSNHKFGCRFCLVKREPKSRKPMYLYIVKARTHLSQAAKAIKADRDAVQKKGVKGLSSLR